MPFPDLLGTYILDLENTTRLQAGAFHEHFFMKPGFDEAVLAFVQSQQHLVGAFRIELTNSALKITSASDEEVLPILSVAETPTASEVAVRWEEVCSRLVRFRVVTLAPEIVRFENPALDLDRFAFKKQPR